LYLIERVNNALDKSSPRAYGQVLAPGHRLKLYYSITNLTIFLGATPLFIDSRPLLFMLFRDNGKWGWFI
jgi:hypothetical protein